MRDLDYLKLLSREYPTARKTAAEIINLKAILALPKGTEYFFSDIHGEYASFRHQLRSASGVVRSKIEETFGNLLSDKEQLALANLIYYPDKILHERKKELTEEFYRVTISQLAAICRDVGTKYTRSKVYKQLPEDFGYAIDELLHTDERDADKKMYYREIINSIAEEPAAAKEFVIALCELIQSLTIDNLHIIGDIFDRGPRADFVMDDLMNFHDVDIQWGNHDVTWMGAAAGNTACIATVLRIATGYNSFDVLEDGYGINLRPLSMYAAETYRDDSCECFLPHLLDKNKYDSVDPALAAKMCKAITIIELKLEGQLIKRHPEFKMEDRLFLDKIDYENYTVSIGGKSYPLKDRNFPTIDPEDPYRLTKNEEELVETLRSSFKHSERLNKHIDFMYSHGSMYKIQNDNLLFHGCIPLNGKGEFLVWEIDGKKLSGKLLMDYLDEKVREAYFMEDSPRREEAMDLMWYLWAGANSPLFGKDKMATFEHTFIEDPVLSVEKYNAYYSFSKDEKTCDRIIREFCIDPEKGHIINGHVPVKVKKGEKPVKANGKLYVIDGGLSKAYHSKTGIAGYTLIFSSHHLALAEHRPFDPKGENTPKMQVTEVMKRRMRISDIDRGREIKQKIFDLEELLECYHVGLIREKR